MALHFGEKLCKSPFTHFRGSVADSLYIFWFQSVACFTIICQMALLPSRLSVAVENDASVHPVADKIILCCNRCVPYCDWWSHVYAGVWLMEPCVCWSVIGWAVYMLVCVWWSRVYAGVCMVEPCVCWCVYGGAVCMLVCVWWSHVYAGVCMVKLCVCWCVIWWSHVYAGVCMVKLCICWCVIDGAVRMLVCDWWSCVYAGVCMVKLCVCWCVIGGAVCMLVCDWWSCVYAGLWSVELCVCWCVYGGAVYMLVCDWWSCVYAGVWLVEGFEYPAVVEFAPFLKVPKKRARKPDPRKATIESGQTLLLSVCLLHTSIITCEIT